MHLSCAICAETIGPSDELNVTPCGHLFHTKCLNTWMMRSLTCPQCRNKVTNRTLVRLFLNVSLNDTVNMDPAQLQNDNDALELQIRTLDAKIRQQEAELKNKKDGQLKARRTIVELEAQLEQKNMLIHLQHETQTELRLSLKRIPQLERDIKEARAQAETLEAIQNVVNATVSEVEAVMQNNHSIRSLCTMVVVLKREMRASEQKRFDMRKTLLAVQSDLKQAKAQETAHLASISALESQLYKAQQDLRQTTGGSSAGPVAKRRHSGSNHSPETLAPNEKSYCQSAACEEAPTTDPPQPSSPYMKVAASSMGLAAIPKARTARVSRLSSHSVHRDAAGTSSDAAAPAAGQFSIFRKARIGTAGALSTLHGNSNRVFNGLGGTDRRDLFARTESRKK